jgi:hypothetical protein
MTDPTRPMSLVATGLASGTWWVPLMALVIVIVGAFIALRLGGQYDKLDARTESDDFDEVEEPPSDEGRDAGP